MFLSKRRIFVAIILVLCLLRLRTFVNENRDGAMESLSQLRDVAYNSIKEWNFAKPDIKLVLILTYNRCGSSFLGNILNSNPDAFYAYEPLDPAFVHLYGTRLGWNIFSDIMYYRNKTRREPTEEELEAMVKTVTEFFTCDTENMYPEVLFSNFWNRFGMFIALGPFKKCLWQNVISPRDCHNKTEGICGNNFDAESTYGKCHDQLQGNTSAVSPQIANYKACIGDMVKKGAPCVHFLKDRCVGAQIRGVKTVRAPMQVAEVLLDRLPNLKVIHLVRDPRPVAYSRRTHESFRATFPQKYDMQHEGTLICDAMLRDIRRRRELAKRYPDRITHIVFEEFASAPMTHTQRIYKFMGEPGVPEKTQAWLKNNINVSQTIAFNWTHLFDQQTWDAIRKHPMCEELYSMMADVWTADFVGSNKERRAHFVGSDQERQ